MIFFIDENFPRKVMLHLNSLGHTTIDGHSNEYKGVDDYILFTKAQQNSAIFLTTDRDFFHTIPFQFENHFGVIVITLSQPNRKAILEKLDWALNNMDIHNFKNTILLLRDKSHIIKTKND